jgi:parvulin-like peptidyl-prolyl isomerase
MHYFRARGRVLWLAGALVLSLSCDKAPASQSNQATKQSSGGASDSSVVARVGAREITLSEVDERALKSNMAVFQQLYDVRRQAIEELLSEALLDAEAARLGISREDLETREIRAKIPEVTAKNVEDFFNENRARIPAGQTLEQLSGQIRQYLSARNELTAREGYLSGLREKAEVNVALEPPRVPIVVAAGERVKGVETAPITIVEYSDFQ